MRKIVLFFLIMILSGCATTKVLTEPIKPTVTKNLMQKEFDILPPPNGKKVSVAVYSFADKTGQRRPSAVMAQLSTAVTQGAEAFLIKALQDVGDQRWFKVLERVGLENLIKERQMIRQMREQYQGREAKQLPPMMFAGMIIEGSISGYDTSLKTGGSGMRVLGIGATTQYQSDTVTVTLRTVSVNTGEVLTTVTISKTILSYMDKLGVLKFVSEGEKAIEAEIGASVNESINRATDLAIQAAVVETIKEGVRKGHWNYQTKNLTNGANNETIK
jgi:curli production assembly/transport component CsgG